MQLLVAGPESQPELLVLIWTTGVWVEVGPLGERGIGASAAKVKVRECCA